MKFSAVALATVVAVVSAQGIADIPACAQTCLLPALQATGCSLTDFKCSCSNKSFVSDSTDCIEGACSPADIAKAAKATYELCKAAGVEIVTRAPPAATTSAAPTTAEPEPTTAEPTTAEPTTAEPEPTTSEAVSSSAGPTYGEPEPSTTAAVSSTYAPAPTTIISTTAAGNATQTQPPPPPSTGAAVAIAGNVVLALGGAVAAFFL
ncbi:hypothetical protein TWF569_002570 [Orbilia oligospora]|uniref:CFEM domain-containing protein n=1 Tax=Orbilia oligospora TaxID=2813651 RepID=A0A7C8NQ49_ORBOL|nr:hypothetical protein TWF706_009690 [Orbilia oligospora]KAF3102715.1 hypothetical protein TWF102_004383 [Orbilia oligospora]KAF3110432.1 hypothetical protein TWF103_004705 [Orbilia oligospora]KAF3121523.1 hypothetical protein TWF569_002570 [Orbilia oligospora]KAF3130198.1 hypothetical protein TWF703_008365 [Orbilia oligospora]